MMASPEHISDASGFRGYWLQLCDGPLPGKRWGLGRRQGRPRNQADMPVRWPYGNIIRPVSEPAVVFD